MSLHTYDGFLAALLAANVDRPVAERMAAAKFGRAVIAHETPSEDDLRQKIEDEHVAAGDRLMRALGFEVVCFSQKKRAKVTPGIPDRRYYRRPRQSLRETWPAVSCWWEAKADRGRQRPDQRAFQEMVEACGEVYVLGKLEVLKAWLVANHIAVRTGELFEIPSSAA